MRVRFWGSTKSSFKLDFPSMNSNYYLGFSSTSRRDAMIASSEIIDEQGALFDDRRNPKSQTQIEVSRATLMLAPRRGGYLDQPMRQRAAKENHNQTLCYLST